MKDPVLKGNVNCKNHSSILKIGEVCKKITTFLFSCVDKYEIFK